MLYLKAKGYDVDMKWDFNELFGRYFDEKKAGKPYENCGEHITDKLRALDLLIELYVGLRKIDEEGPPVDNNLLYGRCEVLDLISAESPLEAKDNFEADVCLQTVKLPAHIKSRESADLPLIRLRDGLKLTDFGEFCAVMAAASHFARKYERVFAYLQDGQKSPTVGLCLALYNLFEETAFSEVERLFFNSDSPGKVLFKLSSSAPIKASAQGNTLLSGTISALPMFYRVLKGGASDYIETAALPPAIGLESIIEPLCNIIKNAAESQKKTIVHVHGTEGSGRLLSLKCAAKKNNRELITADCRELATMDNAAREEALCNLVLRAVAGCKLPVLRCFDFDEESRAKFGDILKFISHYCPLILVTSKEIGIRTSSAALENHELVSLKMPPVSVSQRRELWQYFAGEAAVQNFDFASFANRYGYSAGQIEHIFKLARANANAAGRDSSAPEDVLGAIEQQNALLSPSLKLTKVNCVFTWEDLILPQEQLILMREACNRVKYSHIVSDEWGFSKKLPYGTGISVLLYGAPGTGKTMSAQVMANELHVPLYKIDLSQLVSKYIGETEKNLAEIFEFGSKSNCILFFDEADSLFGKRTEVKDSHDKHANTETAFLLQKIEEHTGISILSTNLLNNIDTAFRRRFTYIISVPKPDAEMRLKLWKSAFPADVPLAGDISFERLAEKLELTGSSIKSIALEAAYAAAAAGIAVNREQVFNALRNDMIKNGSGLSQGDLLELY